MHTAGDMRWWPQQAHDTLHIAVTMDKGDISTKMQLVFLNTEHPQSPRDALPIALFEGPEEHELMEEVFGPLYLALASPPAGFAINSRSEHGTEAPVGRSGVYRSGKCEVCVATGEPATVAWCPQVIAIRHVAYTYGGDTVGLHELLGLSGHMGTYFCACCMAKLDSLRPPADTVHALPSDLPWALKKAVGEEPFRLLEDLRQWNQEYVEEGEEKSRMAEKGNAVRRCLPATEIAGNTIPPVLHIVMAMCEKVRPPSSVENNYCELCIGKQHQKQQIIAKLEEHAEEHDEEAVKARVVAKDARPFTDVLKAALRRHNVRRSKMFGGKFCGDAASRLFANAEDVAKVLQPQTFGDEPTADSKEEQKGSTIGGRWHVVMGCALGAMSCITGLIMRPAPLCEHELNSLQELVTVFANHWRVHYPDDATTPLLHNLVIDVPRFARLHGTV